MSTNDFNLNELLSSMSELKSSKGLKKENIYKSNVFAQAITDRDKKDLRRKLRNVLDNFLQSYLSAKNDKTKLQKIAKDWLTYYQNVYVTNDFKVDSIASKNKDENKREHLSKMLTDFQNCLQTTKTK